MVPPILLYFTFALTTTMAFAETSDIEARIHKLPFGILLFHSFSAMVVILVIIKLVLAIGFVGMLTFLAHAFGGIKNLLKFGAFKHDSDHFAPDDFHNHESIIDYDPAGPAGFLHPGFSPAGYSSQGYSSQGFSSPGYSSQGISSQESVIGPVALRREQTLEGGRYSRDPATSREHNLKKRSMERTATPIFHRKIRSTDTDDNCKRKLICELNAKARRNPTYAYKLYFIRKKGLAKYWNHEDIKYDECKKRYPCQKRNLNSKTPDIKGRATDEYDDDYYNTDYETEYTSANYGSYDNVQYS